MSISHGAAFMKTVDVKSGDYKRYGKLNIVVITAGANQKPGETRIDLIRREI